MNEHENRRASAFRVRVCPIEQLSSLEEMSIFNRSLQNPTDELWCDVGASSIEFTEKLDERGKFWEVELKFKVTDVSRITKFGSLSALDEDCLVLIDFSNGESRLVGSPEVPIVFTSNTSGTPSALQYEYKGNQPVESRLIQSF